MTLDEFYRLSPEESLDKIRGECRSRARTMLCLGALIVLYSIYDTISWRDAQPRAVLLFSLSAGCLIGCWIILNNLWFLHRMNRLDTPELLLHGYKKRHRNDHTAVCLTFIVLIISNPRLWYDIINMDWGFVLVELIMTVVIIAAVIYALFNEHILYSNYLEPFNRRDEEIFDRLEDLAEKK